MIKKASFVALLALTIAVLGFGVANALESKGEGLTVSPPISEITAKPGEKLTKTIKLTNPTQDIVTVYPRVMDFGAKGEGGEPSFFDPGSDSDKYSLAKWIGFTQSQISLAPEQVVEFSYQINVPAVAEPGGHYGVVFFATEPPKDDSTASRVSLGSMIGSLLLVKVPGQITEKGMVESFTTDKWIYLSGATALESRISNYGNVHFSPQGTIIIKNMFGREVATLAFNEQRGNILPDSVRKFDNSYQPTGLQIGKYTAVLSVVYGESEKTLQANESFWLIPWWLIVVLAILFALIVGYLIYRRFKKGKRATKDTTPKSSPPTSSIDNGRPILR